MKTSITLFFLVIFNLILYGQDGALDATFGGGDGKVITAFGSKNDRAYGVVIQTDGKIVVAGQSNNGSNYDFAVARYNTDGSLDTSFDGDSGTGNGIVATTVSARNDQAYSVIIQTDGKILVAGNAEDGSGFDDFAIVRYNNDGTLDTSFDTDGMTTTAIDIRDDFGKSVAIQSDGKILVAGYYNNGSKNKFAVVNYNSDGSLNTSFDTDGIVTTSFGASHDYGFGVAIQSDGNIVVAGYSDNGTDFDFAAARYSSNGALDASFNSDGKLTTAIGSVNDKAFGIVIQSDGKILLVGQSDNGSDDDFALVRYNSDGSLDTGFDGDGKQTTSFGTNEDYAKNVAIQDDGKIVVVGQSGSGFDYDFAIARYNNPSLPVELTSFTGTAINNLVRLIWQTATEVNNYGFEIERAIDVDPSSLNNGYIATGWENIGFVQGHGNSNSPKYYSFTDSFPPSGKLFYRLKQVDTDGKFEYSDVVEVDVSSPDKLRLEQNYPNPFSKGVDGNSSTIIEYAIPSKGTQDLNKSGQSFASQKVTLKIYDILGRKVATLVNEEQPPGNYKIRFNGNELPSGIYFYQLRYGEFADTKKMIMMK